MDKLREQFSVFKPSQHSYNEVMQFYKSDEARMVCGWPLHLSICVAKSYYNNRLTGIEYVNLQYLNGRLTVLDIFSNDPKSSAYGVLEGINFSLTCYNIVHDSLINLQLDKKGSIRFTTKYMKKVVRIPDVLRPISINVTRPYKPHTRMEYHYGGKFTNDGGNIFADVKDVEVIRNRINVLSRLNLAEYFDISKMDLQNGRTITWKPNVN